LHDGDDIGTSQYGISRGQYCGRERVKYFIVLFNFINVIH